MEHILDDIPPLIASYLPPLDAINFGRTCRKLRSQLSLTVARRRILTGFVRHDRDDDRHYGFEIPVPSRVATHSVLVSMRWKDQGWGNIKGRVFVVAEEETRTRGVAGRVWRSAFGGGRMVVSSGIAPHDLERLSFVFKPRQDESYHLWYAVGGGGGHSLRLSNVNVQALMFDDGARSLNKAHAFLARSNIFHPFDVMESRVHQFHRDTLKAILASTSHALAHGLEVSPPMITFFGSYGISSADLSLELIQSIEAVWTDWEQKLSDYMDTERNNGNGREDSSDGDDSIFRYGFRHDWLNHPEPGVYPGPEPHPEPRPELPLPHVDGGGDVISRPRHRRFVLRGRFFGRR